MKAAFFLPLTTLVAPACFAASVSVPFSTDFDDFTAGTTITALLAESNNSTANSSFVDLGAGDIALRQTAGAGNGTHNTAASVTTPVADLASGGGFEFRTTFTLDSFTVGSSGVINTSLNALASSTGLGTGYRLTYTLSDGGSLVINQNGGTTGFTNIVPTTNLAPVAGQTYTIIFQGTYTSATSLNLFGSISNGTTTVSTSVSDSSIPAETDNNFGIRTAIGASTTSSAIQLTTTEFSLAVPEPASAGMAFLSVGLLALRRKRA